MCKHVLDALMLMLLFGVSVASAGTIYEPLQVQRGPGIWYGGSNPHVADYVRKSECLEYHSGVYPHDFVTKADRPLRVYSDCAPYMNMAAFGYTPADAMNEAHANEPRYFRKGDLLNARVLDGDGRTYVVPARTQGIPSAPSTRDVEPRTQPATQPILIIPKRMLERPAKPVETKVARTT